MHLQVFLLFIFLSLPATLKAQNLLKDIKIGAAADIIAPLSLDDSDENLVQVRSAELMFYGPIDQVFDAVLNIAGHNEDGEFVFELHEGFISSSKLIPRSRFRIGKFFLGAGRLNSFHQHDWPFISAPKVFREFFAPGAELITAEGATDTGLEYSWLLPVESFVELTVGVTNNSCYGHCHGNGLKPPRPLYYIHPTFFLDFGESSGLLLGASYLSRKDGFQVLTDLFGLEATYKKREGNVLKWLLQAEAFLEVKSGPLLDTTEKAGAYVFSQYGLDQNWSFGFRLDGYSHLNMKFASNNQKRKDFDYAFVPTLTYKASEFSTVRLAYSHEVDTTQGVSNIEDRQFQLQFIYILGAHAAHDF